MSGIRNITVSTVQDVTFSSNMISDADIRAEFERRFGAPTPQLGSEGKQIIADLVHALHLMKDQASMLQSDIESAQCKICDNDGYKDSVHETVRNLPDTPVNEVQDRVEEILNDLDYIETDVDLDDQHAQDLYDKAKEAERDIERLKHLLGLNEDEGHDPSDDREPALENMTELA
jgi:hypothetical protein